MAGEPSDLSDDFAALAREEAQRLRARAVEVRTRGERWIERGQAALAEAERIEGRVQELDELLGRAPQLRLDLQGAPLHGRELRKAAVRVLIEQQGPRQPIHYRDWYRLVTETGFTAAGKDPLATFLTQITRSPLVERVGEASGTYQLDPSGAYERARAELAEATRALTKAEDQLQHSVEAQGAPSENDLRAVRAARERLARAQRGLDAIIAARLALRAEQRDAA